MKDAASASGFTYDRICVAGVTPIHELVAVVAIQKPIIQVSHYR